MIAWINSTIVKGLAADVTTNQYYHSFCRDSYQNMSEDLLRDSVLVMFGLDKIEIGKDTRKSSHRHTMHNSEIKYRMHYLSLLAYCMRKAKKF